MKSIIELLDLLIPYHTNIVMYEGDNEYQMKDFCGYEVIQSPNSKELVMLQGLNTIGFIIPLNELKGCRKIAYTYTCRDDSVYPYELYIGADFETLHQNVIRFEAGIKAIDTVQGRLEKVIKKLLDLMKGGVDS